MKPKNTSRLVFPALILAGSLAAPFAQAASQTWDGGSVANGNWSTVGNWLGDPTAPGATSGTTNTDVATFNAAIANTWGNAVGNPIVIDSATQNIGGISFGGATGNYFIGSTGGNSLLLTSGGAIQILNTLTATNAVETINAPLVIQGGGGTYTFANHSANGSGVGAGTLNFGGGITGGAAGATVLTLSGTNTNANTISGIIGNGSATTMAITKSGVGTWKLTGANTYTGATTINAGTLNLDFSAAGAPASGIINNGAVSNATANSALVLGGGTLLLTGKSATTSAQYFANTTLSANSGSTITLTQNGATSLTASLGAITRNAGSTFGFSNVPLTSGIIATTANANVNGILGTWATVGTTTALQYATVNVSNQIVSYTGATAGTAGTLANVTSAADNYSFAAAATLTGNITANTLRYTGGAATVANNGNNITLNGLMNAGTGSTLSINGFGNLVIGANQELVIAASKDITINTKIVDSPGGASSLIFNGSGSTLTLGNDNFYTAANTYSGGTVINAGTINVGQRIQNAFGSGPITVNTGAKLVLNNNGTYTNSLFLNGATIEGGNGFGTILSGPAVLSGTTTLDTLTTGNFAFTGNLSGTGGLTKNGTSTAAVTLSGTNTYSGPTTVNAGILLVKNSLYGNDTAQWTPANIKVASGGILALNVGGASDFTVAQAGTMLANISTGVNNNGLVAGAIFGLDATNAPAGPLTFAGTIADSTGTGGGLLNFTKLGSAGSTLRLTGANTYTGKTTIYGMLSVSSLNSVNGGTPLLSSSSLGAPTTVANGTVNFGDSGGGGGTGGLIYTGTGETTDRVINLSAQGGTITLDHQGTSLLKFTSNNSGANTLIGNNNGTKTLNLQGSTAGTGEIAAIIPSTFGTLNVTKNGSGTWTLSSANTYGGSTTINGGLLRFTNVKSGTGVVTIAKSGALGGSSSVAGLVTVQVGDATNAGGAIRLTDGAVGNLTLTAAGTTLTFQGSAAFSNNIFFDLGNGSGGTDKIITTGAHSAATAGGVLVNLNQLAGGAVTPGTYTLIQGGAASVFTGYSLATTRAGRNLYSALGASGNNLNVTVAAGNAGDTGGSDQFSYWKGSTAVWNTAQWYQDSAATITSNTPGYSTNVRFAATTPANLTNTLGQDYEINSLTVDSGLSATSISGNMLTIDATTDNSNTAGNGITVNNVAGTTIASKVGLAASQTWTVGTSATLTVSGAVSDFGAGFTLTKAGAGTLALNGLNTYTGGTVVNLGTLSTAGPNGISAAFGTGAITLASGTTFHATGGSATTFNNAFNLTSGTVTVPVPFGGGADVVIGGLISGAGGLTVTSDTSGRKLTLPNANTFTGGVILSGTAASPKLTISNVAALGTGTLRSELTGVNNGGLDWTTDLSVGTGVTNAIDLATGANMNLGLNSSAAAKFSGVISGAGILNKGGTSTAILSGANLYTGGTNVNGGTLTFLNTAAKPATGTTTVAATATLGLGVGGAGFFSSANVDSLFANTLTNVTLNATSRVGIDTTAGDFTYSTSNGTSTLGFAKLGINTLTVSGSSGFSGITTVAGGTLKLGSAGNSGNTPLGTNAAGTTVNSGATLDLNGFTLSTVEALNINGTGVGAGGALVNTSTIAATYSGLIAMAGNSTIAATNGDIVLSNAGTIAGGNLTLSGNLTATAGSSIASIIGIGSSTVTKTGTGTWTVSGANTYTGATAINGGTLKLGSAGSGANSPLGTAGAGTSVEAGGTLDLNGFTLVTAEALTLKGPGVNANGALANSSATAATYSGLVTLGAASTIASFSGNIVLSNAGTIAGATFGLTLDGTATGSSIASIIGTTTGTLTKNGPGTWALSGANTYTGITTVNNGALVLNHLTALPGGIATAGGTSALTFNGGVLGLGNGPFTRSLAAAGVVTGVNFTGAGGWAAYTLDRTVNLGGAGTPITITWATANTGFNGQTLILSNATATHTVDVQNPLDLGTAARTVQVDNGTGAIDGKLSGNLSGAGGNLTKTGAGTLELSGTNSYTGTTAVNAGTLLINGANTGGGLVSVASGATLGGTGSTTAAVNVTGVLSPGASIQSLASGALTMTTGSSFVFEAIDNTSTGADLMVVNGALSLTGVTLDLSAANLGLNTWIAGDKLTLISYTGPAITSGFTGYTDDTTYTGGIFGTNQWLFNYNDSTAGANYNSEATGSSFVTFTVVPEPRAALLGGLGMLVLLRRRRA